MNFIFNETPKRGAVQMVKFTRGWMDGKDLDFIVDEIGQWFLINGIEPPRVAKDWSGVGLKVPPNTGSVAIKNYTGLSIGQFFQYFKNGKVVEKGNYTKMTPERLKEHGITLISKVNKALTIICDNCMVEQPLHFDVAVDLIKRGQQYCSTCNGNTGKSKPLSYYQDKFKDLKDFKIISFQDGSADRFIVQHLKCNNTQGVSFTHLNHTIKDRLNCIHCNSNPGNFNTTQIEINQHTFRSKIEYDIYVKLVDIIGSDNINIEPLYQTLGIETARKFRADFYIPKLDLILEVTSSKNRDIKYNANLKEKLSLLDLQNRNYAFITSVEELEDIVHK